jgi:hypothetical protein
MPLLLVRPELTDIQSLILKGTPVIKFYFENVVPFFSIHQIKLTP